MDTDGWVLRPWSGMGWGGVAWEQRVAQWSEWLDLVEGYYARMAAGWGLPFTPLAAEDRLAAARWAAWTGAQPSVALVYLLQDWS